MNITWENNPKKGNIHIYRNKVKRLIDAGDEAVEPELSSSNCAVRVMGWLRDERFCDEKGEPYALFFGSNCGSKFEDLVKEYNGDLTPRVILDCCIAL